MARAAKKDGFKVIPEGERKCVWMEAGVVSYKTCHHNFDCPTCEYDQALRKKVARAQEAADGLVGRLKLISRLDDWTRLTLRDGDSFLECAVDVVNHPTRNRTADVDDGHPRCKFDRSTMISQRQIELPEHPPQSGAIVEVFGMPIFSANAALICFQGRLELTIPHS